MSAMELHMPQPAARLLAVAVAANGRIDPREVAALDQLDAYGLLAVGRDRFLGMAEEAVKEIGTGLSETQMLRLSDRSRLLLLQFSVEDPKQRILVCRLSDAVIHADGEVTPGERQIYDSLMRHWALSPASVAESPPYP